MKPNSRIKTAQIYAKRGFQLIPVHASSAEGLCSCKRSTCTTAGKHPKIKDWVNKASKDSEQIKKWFGKETDVNIGIVTGKKSGFYVLDVDPRHGGDKSVTQLESEYGALPKTPTVLTGGGGKHYYFAAGKIDLKNKVGLRPGIDFRAEAGMIVAPPSKHSSGKSYKWARGLGLDDVRLAPMPDFLIKLCTEPQLKNSANKSEKEIEQGSRNDTLFRLGCALNRHELGFKDILEALLIKNRQECKPPLSESEVKSIAESCCRYDNSQKSHSPYEVQNGCTVHIRVTKKGEPYADPLANFVATITKEQCRDDGIQKKIAFTVEGKLSDGTTLPTLQVPAEEFGEMGWVIRSWGSRTNVAPGYSKKDHLRSAVQSFSQNAKRVQVYTHVGWVKIDGENAYLHAGGAITKSGNLTSVLVDPEEGRLNDYLLPNAAVGEDLRKAVEATLLLLKAAPTKIAYPLLAAIFRAPLNHALEIEFTLFVAGPTGVLKTSLCAIVQSHFGLGFNGMKMPESWTSTANTIERKSFLVKDSLLTIDDYVPGTVSDRDTDRVFRGAGNRSGRGRSRPDGSIRPTSFPRGLTLVTGEDVPKGHSIRARMCILEVAAGDVKLEILSQLQSAASAGLFAQVMSSYVQWLAPRMDTLKQDLKIRHQELREIATESQMHKRTPDVTASLGIGLDCFLRFIKDVGLISEEDRSRIWEDGWSALAQSANTQSDHHVEEDPVFRSIELIQAALISGQAHLADSRTDGHPVNHKQWGWKESGDRIVAQGSKIGWISGEEAQLNLDSVFSVIQTLAQSQGRQLAIHPRTLSKRLAERGLIITENDQKNLTKRTIPGGGRPRLLVFPDKGVFLTGMPSAPKAPIAPTTNSAIESLKKEGK